METLGKIWEVINISERANKLALGAIRLIKKRTRQGIDISGNPFIPYSKKYARKRERAGKETSIVNLVYDDYFGMMNKIDHIVARDLSSVSILIDDKEKSQIARYHNIEGAGKGKVIRKFWGLSEEEEAQLGELAELEIKNIISSL